MKRRDSKRVFVGTVAVGGGSRISIQSMTNTDTHDVNATISQIKRLVSSGCDIVRITVPDIDAAESFRIIREKVPDVPLVADIHFDYRIALLCADYGVDKIRINPGNIGDEERVGQVARICLKKHIPIRIGVNGGSLEKDLLNKFGSPSPEALFESAMRHVRLLNKFDFDDIVISVKSSSVMKAIDANRFVASNCRYPLHIGVTEAGSRRMGIIKNAAALGALISEGIGDTVRVSLTDDPEEEVSAAFDILRSIGCEGHTGMDIISCPTCGRTKIDLFRTVAAFEDAVQREGLNSINIRVALMGCIVNGPGEAREADVGIAGGVGEALLFAHGQPVRKVPEDKIIPTLIQYIKDNYLE